MSSHSSTGSPCAMKYALPATGEPGVEPVRRPGGGRRRRCRCTVASTFTGREPIRRSRPDAGLGDDPRDEVVVARPPDQVRAQRDRGELRPVARPAPRARPRLGLRVGGIEVFGYGTDSSPPSMSPAVVNHARRPGVDQPADAVLPAGGDDVLGPVDVGGEEVLVPAPDARPWRRRGRRRRTPPPPARRPSASARSPRDCSTPSSSSHG